MTTSLTRADANRARVLYGDVYAEIGFSPEDLAVIKRTVAPGISDNDLALFARVCKHSGLDPFAKQIYAVMRQDRKSGTARMVIQTGIDGYRLIAERTGKYAGQDGPFWCGEDGVWKEFWTGKTPPVAAKVGVYRTGSPHPTYAVATYEEFAQRYDGKPTGKWADMPAHMLAIRAESHALRRAFPNETSAIEMADDPEPQPIVIDASAVSDLYPPEDNDPFRARLNAPPRSIREASEPPAVDPTIPPAGVTMRVMHARAAEHGMDHDALRAFAMGILDVQDREGWSMKDMKQAQAREVFDALEGLVDAEVPAEPDFAEE